MNKDEKWTYWKKPWGSIVVFCGGILQLISLRLRYLDYIDLRASGFLSPSEWEKYAACEHFDFAITGSLIAVFFGTFLIGCVVKTKKEADFAAIVLGVILTLYWGICGFVLKWYGNSLQHLLVWMVFLSGLFATIYAFRVYKRHKNNNVEI